MYKNHTKQTNYLNKKITKYWQKYKITSKKTLKI